MTLQQLKYIVEITSQGSFNKAAKTLFITQPTLSLTVKELENEIGFNIFRRSNKGIELTVEGSEFLGYARQVLEQTDLMESKYLGKKKKKQLLSISTQHYAFAVNAFVELIKEYGEDEYEFALRETKTYEIIEDVKNFKSDIGLLYINDFNEKVINKFLKENHLKFTPLFKAKPHVFISTNNPLVNKDIITLDDLDPYPYLYFSQGEYNSFYFSEEILSTTSHKKSIVVNDRATLFNLLIGLNGYTISTGIISEDLNGDNIVARSLDEEDEIRVGYVIRKDNSLTELAESYINFLINAIK